MRVHLGCGANVLDGWVNIDIRSDDPRVIAGDVSSLDEVIEDGSASQICACHVFEHVARAFQVPVLTHWLSKLEPGGACFISVPDFNQLVGEYVRALGAGEQWWTSDKSIISSLLGGFEDGSEDEFNHHKSLFDFLFMEHLMVSAGFVGVRRYQVSEMGFDPQDHSTRALSLNVVGYRSEASVTRAGDSLRLRLNRRKRAE